MAKAKKAVPEGFHTVTPQLTLDNAAQAIEWYKKALGAEETGARHRPRWEDHARGTAHRQLAHHAERRDDGQ